MTKYRIFKKNAKYLIEEVSNIIKYLDKYKNDENSSFDDIQDIRLSNFLIYDLLNDYKYLNAVHFLDQFILKDTEYSIDKISDKNWIRDFLIFYKGNLSNEYILAFTIYDVEERDPEKCVMLKRMNYDQEKYISYCINHHYIDDLIYPKI